MGQTLGGAFWMYRTPLILSGCNHEREALFPIYTDVETEAHRNHRRFIIRYIRLLLNLGFTFSTEIKMMTTFGGKEEEEEVASVHQPPIYAFQHPIHFAGTLCSAFLICTRTLCRILFAPFSEWSNHDSAGISDLSQITQLGSTDSTSLHCLQIEISTG